MLTKAELLAKLHSKSKRSQRSYGGVHCLEWQEFRHKGYGRVRVGPDKKRVHIVAYTLLRGPIPKGHGVHHHCDNPACWEITHLWTGTQADNLRDASKKGRMGRLPGKGRRKLRLEKVYRILEAKSHKTAQEAAEKFGVSVRHVRRIWNGDSWAWLT